MVVVSAGLLSYVLRRGPTKLPSPSGWRVATNFGRKDRRSVRADRKPIAFASQAQPVTRRAGEAEGVDSVP